MDNNYSTVLNENNLDLLLNGYFRKCENEITNKNIPNIIKDIVKLYFPQRILYKGIFIKANCYESVNILNTNKINTLRSGSARLDIPLPLFDKKSPYIYYWSIQAKCIGHNGKNIGNLQWFIGVISNETKKF